MLATFFRTIANLLVEIVSLYSYCSFRISIFLASRKLERSFSLSPKSVKVFPLLNVASWVRKASSEPKHCRVGCSSNRHVTRSSASRKLFSCLRNVFPLRNYTLKHLSSCYRPKKDDCKREKKRFHVGEQNRKRQKEIMKYQQSHCCFTSTFGSVRCSTC